MSTKFEEIWMASATLQGLLWELKQNNGENIDLLRSEISDLLSMINAAIEAESEKEIQAVSKTVIADDEYPIETETDAVSGLESEIEKEIVSADESETTEEDTDPTTAVTESESETVDEENKVDEETIHTPQPVQPEILSVDLKLSRKVAGDIRKAFSLNDKFLYRRELFGNSAQQYDAALDLISEMEGYEDAETYFLDNYGWDKENAHVKSFMKILYNHFKSIQ